jgi:hypothetical protein
VLRCFSEQPQQVLFTLLLNTAVFASEFVGLAIATLTTDIPDEHDILSRFMFRFIDEPRIQISLVDPSPQILATLLQLRPDNDVIYDLLLSKGDTGFRHWHLLDALAPEKGIALLFQLLDRGVHPEEQVMYYCLENCHIKMAWSCALSLLFNSPTDVEFGDLPPITSRRIESSVVPVFLVMASILFRVCAECTLKEFWPALANYVAVVLSEIARVFDFTQPDFLFSFSSLLGIFGFQTSIHSEQQTVSRTSEYVFHPISPYSEPAVRLTESSQSTLQEITMDAFVDARVASFDISEREDHFNLQLESIARIIVVVLSRAERSPRKVVDYLNTFLLANPFCPGEHRWRALCFVVQLLHQSSSISNDVVVTVVDWTCDRVIEGRFAKRPTSVLAPILGRSSRLPRKTLAKMLLALEVSITLVDQIESRNAVFSFLNLLMTYESVIFQRIDIEFAVALLEALAKIANDQTLEAECFQLLDILCTWLSIHKAAKSYPDVVQWARSMRDSQQISAKQFADVYRANEVLLARQTKAVSALLSEVKTRIVGIQSAIEREGVRFLTALQRHRVLSQLEMQNQRKMLAVSFEFDAAAYARAREKANVFPNFVNFHEEAILSNTLRESLFRKVFNLSAHEWVIPVEVEVSGFTGKGLMGSKEDRYYIIDGLDLDFAKVENAPEFEGTLNAVVPMCFRYEGHALIPIDVWRMQPERNAISFALLGDREFQIRALEPRDVKFQSVISRISKKNVK